MSEKVPYSFQMDDASDGSGRHALSFTSGANPEPVTIIVLTDAELAELESVIAKRLMGGGMPAELVSVFEKMMDPLLKVLSELLGNQDAANAMLRALCKHLGVSGETVRAASARIRPE